MTAFDCPYCFTEISTDAVAFRCSGRPASGRPACVPHSDPEREAILGDGSQSYPPVLQHAADGRHLIDDWNKPILQTGKLGRSITCDRCSGPTTIAICPRCHSVLPQGVEDNPVSVAVVGARNSGKTVFLSQLDQQLMSSVPERFHVAVEHPGGTTGLAKKLEEYRNRMLGTLKQLPDQTRAEGDRKQAPAVYRWDRGAGKKRRSAKVVSIYDTPGEAVAIQEQTLQQGHLRSANALILVIDPFSLSENRELAVEKGIDPSPENLVTDVLDGITAMLGESKDKKNRKGMITTPLAVVVTKMDAFWGQLPENSPLRTAATAVPYFDEVDSQTVHDFVDGQLRSWGGANLANKIEGNYADFRYFAVSALGGEPSYRDGKLFGAASPTRVVDPILWILNHEKSFLPTAPAQDKA